MAKGHFIMLQDLPPDISASAEDEGSIRIPMGTSMAESEKLIIRSTLNYAKGNKSRTAEILGIGRKTLHRKFMISEWKKSF